MKSHDVDIYVFSGTGNTYLVAQRMAKTMSDRGCQVRVRRLEAWDPGEVDLNRTLGLAFPVAAQTTYELVWDFCRGLRQAQGTEAFMVDTMAGFSGGIVGPLQRLMKAKGYAPLGAKEIIMPINFGRPKINREKDARTIERGLATATAYANALLDGQATWGRIPILSDLMRALGGSPLTWRLAAWWGARTHVDQETCTRCGLCARFCPTGNIRMEGYPRFLGRCQDCLRCLGLCPVHALRVFGLRSQPYQAMSFTDLERLDPPSGP